MRSPKDKKPLFPAQPLFESPSPSSWPFTSIEQRNSATKTERPAAPLFSFNVPRIDNKPTTIIATTTTAPVTLFGGKATEATATGKESCVAENQHEASNSSVSTSEPNSTASGDGMVLRSLFPVQPLTTPAAGSGTSWIPFKATVERDPQTNTNQYNSFEHICFQLDYQQKSPEELRLADYRQIHTPLPPQTHKDLKSIFPGVLLSPSSTTRELATEPTFVSLDSTGNFSQEPPSSPFVWKPKVVVKGIETKTFEQANTFQLSPFVHTGNKYPNSPPLPMPLPDRTLHKTSNANPKPVIIPNKPRNPLFCFGQPTPEHAMEITDLKDYHLGLLSGATNEDQIHEAAMTPIFTVPVLKHANKAEIQIKKSDDPYPQYGLLAGLTDMIDKEGQTGITTNFGETPDPRVFFNIASPSSTFICGSQGSGKSHTLSCMLENCLLASKVSKLPHPLTGLVLHYDHFISDDGGSPCEAAFLSSNPEIKVRVLCAPTNIRTIRASYQRFPNITVEALKIDQQNLNTKRMLDMMSVNRDEGQLPLYLHGVTRVLRHMRLAQQETGGEFSYEEFKRQVLDMSLSPAQLGPLNQRLDVLESFMVKDQTPSVVPTQEKSCFNCGQQGHKSQHCTNEAIRVQKRGGSKPKVAKSSGMRGTDWSQKPSHLTIIDLSCPCVTAEDACVLFNICLSIFLESDPTIGRVIALDEAHKYMNTSSEASTLTNTLLSAIRLQRHLGVRTIISTQEPTISPALLDLSSLTIVHRFTSPEWLRALKQHLAGASTDLVAMGSSEDEGETGRDENSKGDAGKIFGDIVGLRVGEALLFCPSALMGVEEGGRNGFKRLGTGYAKIRIRTRITDDGGKSVMAS